MRIGRMICFRNTMKNPKKAQKLIERINLEIKVNDSEYKERDKELKDLLKMIELSQEIINSEE